MKFDLNAPANRYVAVAEPLVIDDPEQYQWDAQTDIAVVGVGMAGACAALEAAAHGAEVLALDRLAAGGASRLSGGVVYAGGGTRQQQEAGIEDSPDNMYQYLRIQVGDVVKDDTLRRFCHDSVANLEWLEGHGVRFGSRYYKEKNSFPGGYWGLYHSGNEAYAPYNAQTTTAARGHVTQGSGYFGGPAMMQNLLAAMQRSGEQPGQGRIRLQKYACVSRLLVDKNQQVVGLAYRLGSQSGLFYALRTGLHTLASKLNIGLPRTGAPFRWLAGLFDIFDREQRVRVRRGVILSAGGFVFNRAMVTQATGHAPLTPHALGEDCNGSGIRLGLSLGALGKRLERLTYWRFYAPPHAWLKTIALDPQGRRLCNEALYGATVADIMLEKDPQGRGWLILDEAQMQAAKAQLRNDKAFVLVQKAMAWMYMYRCTQKAATLAELARKTGLPLAQLEQTVAEYNQRIQQGQPDTCAKPDAYRAELNTAPWYAIDISIGSKFACPSLTLGGLEIDEETGQVLRAPGQVIPGLYAAGRNAAGLCAHTYISGLSLADCLFSGRRAGQHAAKQVS
ncbi:MAG: FAD-binding protein [Sterolibacterium sp.]|nr:FAD-binding protein [Sterolibacterium sp.]